MNKIIVLIFALVFIVTGVLLFYALSVQKRAGNDKSTPIPSPTEYLTSINEKFVTGAEKIINRNSNIAFYALESILVDEPIYDAKNCSFSGSFYLLGDSAKNNIKYKFDCAGDLFPVGIFEKGFNSSSTWKFIDKDNFLKLAKSGAKVQIRGNFYLDNEGRIQTAEYDEIFRSITNSNGAKISIPENSFFNISAIGFTNE